MICTRKGGMSRKTALLLCGSAAFYDYLCDGKKDLLASGLCFRSAGKAVEQIGDKMKSGEKHDGRAPDYDDWKLNGDIIVYYPVLDIALELSSMGVRVDPASLREQLAKAGCEERAKLAFQKDLLEGRLPLTIGGGIGQSRICMFYLRKAHIGEVQSSVWPDGIRAEAERNHIHLL